MQLLSFGDVFLSETVGRDTSKGFFLIVSSLQVTSYGHITQALHAVDSKGLGE